MIVRPKAGQTEVRHLDGRASVEAFSLPRAFWVGMNARSVGRLLDQDGLLTRAEASRLWRLLGEGDRPPSPLQVQFDVARVVAEWPIASGPVDRRQVPAVLLAALLRLPN